MHAGKKAEELGLPGILSVTESSQIARDLLLAEATGVHYHVCHVSTKESVRVIRDAKSRNPRNSRSFTPSSYFDRRRYSRRFRLLENEPAAKRTGGQRSFDRRLA